MLRKLMPYFFLLSAISTFGQTRDLAGQLRMVKDLIPSSARLGMIYNPRTANIDSLISIASQDTGLVIYKAPVANTREMTTAIRSLSKYDVDFIFLIEDKRVTGVQAIKFVVKQTMRRKIPVFTTSANAHKGGGYGWLVENGPSWLIKINSNVRDRFDISIPEDAKFVIEE